GSTTVLQFCALARRHLFLSMCRSAPASTLFPYTTLFRSILLYPAAQLATVLGLTDLFVFAQRIASERGATDTPLLRISQWQMQSPHESPVRIQDSLPGTNTRPAVLILPPSLEEPIATSAAAPYREWLQAQHRDGTTLASVCAGAFLLGETGLLSGRTITTHWLYVEKFSERFPGVQ